MAAKCLEACVKVKMALIPFGSPRRVARYLAFYLSLSLRTAWCLVYMGQNIRKWVTVSLMSGQWGQQSVVNFWM